MHYLNEKAKSTQGLVTCHYFAFSNCLHLNQCHRYLLFVCVLLNICNTLIRDSYDDKCPLIEQMSFHFRTPDVIVVEKELQIIFHFLFFKWRALNFFGKACLWRKVNPFTRNAQSPIFSGLTRFDISDVELKESHGTEPIVSYMSNEHATKGGEGGEVRSPKSNLL